MVSREAFLDKFGDYSTSSAAEMIVWVSLIVWVSFTGVHSWLLGIIVSEGNSTKEDF
jgi:hypothetical protein